MQPPALRAPNLGSAASWTDKALRPPNPFQVLGAVILARKPLQKLLEGARIWALQRHFHAPRVTDWGHLSQSATQEVF